MSDTSPSSGRYEYSAITEALKQILRRKKITYGELADRLELSESGIKKIMSADDGSIGRLAEICAAAGVDLFALLELAWKAPPEPFVFSDEQDDFAAANPGHYYFLMALLDSDLDAAAVARDHDLDDRSVRCYLSDLDTHRFIELGPGDRIRPGPGVTRRVRIGPKTRERIGVELQKRLLEHAHRRSVAGESSADDQLVASASLRMTGERLAALNKALHEVVMRFGTDALVDELVTPDDELVAVALLVATTPCELGGFYPIERLESRAAR